MYSERTVKESKLYQEYVDRFEKAHPYDDFVYELNLALETIKSVNDKFFRWKKLDTYDLREAFPWRESVQGISYWKVVE